jgi:hypothetical protein
MARARKQSIHCPVPGCRAKRAHMDDPVVKALNEEFSDPVKLASWVKTALGELINSMKADLQADRILAYMSRLRQSEELYHRALYVLFIASPKEIPHVLSGEMPNGFAAIYKRVNRGILDDRGNLDKPQAGISGDEFTAMRMLNESAHGSFGFLLTCIGIARNPELKEHFLKHFVHLNRYWTYLNYMEEAFTAGKTKADVLVGVKNLHRPASAWKNPPNIGH